MEKKSLSMDDVEKSSGGMKTMTGIIALTFEPGDVLKHDTRGEAHNHQLTVDQCLDICKFCGSIDKLRSFLETSGQEYFTNGVCTKACKIYKNGSQLIIYKA